MRAKHKQSEIQILKRNMAQGQVPTTALIDRREMCFLKQNFYYKILPVHHDCNPNDQEILHELQIRTASSKNRKMNFCLEMKLTVNSSWFRVAMRAKHKQSEIQMVKRNSTSISSNNCLHWWGEKFASWNKIFILKYCQTAIQMI